MRPELQTVLELCRNLAADELPELVGDLEQLRAVVLARLVSLAASPEDHNLTVEETAQRMAVSTDYLYRNWRRLPLARHEGTRLLFSAKGLDAHLRMSARR